MLFQDKGPKSCNSLKCINKRIYILPLFVILFYFLFVSQALANQSNPRRQNVHFDADTSKVNWLLKNANDSLQNGKIQPAMVLTDSAFKLAKQVYFKQGTCEALNLKGLVYYRASVFDSAIFYSQRALVIAKEINDSARQSSIYLVLGSAYSDKGNDIMASNYYFKGLAIEERLHSLAHLYAFLNNIGDIFANRNDLSKGLEFFLRAKLVAEKSKNNVRLSTVYYNIGSVYLKMGKPRDAKEAFEKSYEIAKINKDFFMINMYFSGMSDVYISLKQYDQAYDFALKSIQLLKEQGFKNQITVGLISLANIQIIRHQYNEAEKCLQEALLLSEEINTQPVTKDICLRLSDLYDKKGNYEKAYQYYTRFSSIKDSILNQENSRTIIEMNAKYTTERKQREIELLKKNEEIQKLELLKRKSQLETQQTLSLGFFSGFILLVIVAILLLNRYQLRKKTNEQLQQALYLIEEKNSVIENSNQLITDSIEYAKRIQDAILPTVEELRKFFLNDFFVLYQPSQIVSGDFYWFSFQKEKLIIVIGDCTSRGIPGAFMSLIGNTLLNEIVNEQKVTYPGEIAALLDKKIIETLHQNGESKGIDGINISVCCIDRNNQEINFTGGRQNLYIYNEGLHRMDGDPLSIGETLQQNPKSFTTHSISYAKGLRLYIMTDGYFDQAGKNNNIFFSSKHKQREQLLTDIQSCKMPVQGEILEKEVFKWRENLEQNDDVLVIGIEC